MLLTDSLIFSGQSSSESSSKRACRRPELLPPLRVGTGEELLLEDCDWEQATWDSGTKRARSSVEEDCASSPSVLAEALLVGDEAPRKAFRSFCQEGVGHIFMVLPPMCLPFLEPPLDALTGVTEEDDEPRAFLGARATTAERREETCKN